MRGRFASWGAICCSGMLLGVLSATATAAGGAVSTSQPRQESHLRQHLFAVMGEVAATGVYATRAESPMLWELIRQSGGFTSRATGAVRIVRNGRTTLHTHASGGLRIRLQGGDVVIAGGSSGAPHGTGGASQAGTPVEVALVNLIDRPVVLKLRPRHANLPTLVELLGQHPDVARLVRVVGGGRQSRLRSGSVLVFDPRTVDRHRIPPLPKPIVPEARPPRTNVRTVSSAVSRAPGPIRRAQGTDEDASAAPNSDIRTLRTIPPPELPRTARPAVPGGNPPDRVRMAVKLFDRERPDGRSQPPVPPDEPPATVDRDLILKADRSENGGNDPSASIDLLTLVIGVFAVLGVLSAVGLLVSMARRALRGQPLSNSPSARRRAAGVRGGASIQGRRSRLDQLLRNELEINIEPLAIPLEQTFFGRIAGPQRNRVDHDHAAGGELRPHIDARSTAAPGGSPSSPESRRPTPGTTVRRTDAAQSAPPPPQEEGRTAGKPRSAPVRSREEELG